MFTINCWTKRLYEKREWVLARLIDITFKFLSWFITYISWIPAIYFSLSVVLSMLTFSWWLVRQFAERLSKNEARSIRPRFVSSVWTTLTSPQIETTSPGTQLSTCSLKSSHSILLGMRLGSCQRVYRWHWDYPDSLLSSSIISWSLIVWKSIDCKWW